MRLLFRPSTRARGLLDLAFGSPMSRRESGQRKIIRDGVGGLLMQPQDVDALAERIQFLMRYDDERTRLGAGAIDVLKMPFDIQFLEYEIDGIARQGPFVAYAKTTADPIEEEQGPG